MNGLATAPVVEIVRGEVLEPLIEDWLKVTEAPGAVPRTWALKFTVPVNPFEGCREI